MASATDVLSLPTMEEILQQELVLPEQLVSNALLVRKNLTVIGAPEDSFKTHLACQLAVCLAAGVPWLGHSCHHPAEVVYLVIEGSRDYVVERIEVKLGAMVEDADDRRLMLSRIRVQEYVSKNLDEGKAAEELLAALQVAKPDVVIADPVTYRLQGDNRYGPVMGKLGDNLLKIGRELDAAVVAIIHTRKGTRDDNDMDDFIGSRNLAAMGATRIKLFRGDDKLVSFHAKTRYAERPDSVRLVWNDPLLDVVEVIMTERQRAREGVLESLEIASPQVLGELVGRVAGTVICNEKTVRSAISALEIEGKVEVARQTGSAIKLVRLKGM